MKNVILTLIFGSIIMLVGCRDIPIVASLPFDEGTGTVAKDVSGNRHDGTLSASGPSWIKGIRGSYALGFDGVDDFVTIPASADFASKEFTVSIWLKSNPGNAYCAFLRLVNGWHMRIWAGKLDVVFDNGWYIYDSGYTFPQNEWHHYVITVNVNDVINTIKTITFYVDGARIGNSITINDPITINSGDLYIGQYNESFRWNGAIDDFEFYDYAMSKSEVALLY